MNTANRSVLGTTYNPNSRNLRTWFERSEPEVVTEEQFSAALIQGIQQGDIFSRADGTHHSRVVQGEGGRQYRVEGVENNIHKQPIAFRLYRLDVDQQGDIQEFPIVTTEGQKPIMSLKEVVSYLREEGNASQVKPLPHPDADDEVCAKRPLNLRGLQPSSRGPA